MWYKKKETMQRVEGGREGGGDRSLIHPRAIDRRTGFLVCQGVQRWYAQTASLMKKIKNNMHGRTLREGGGDRSLIHPQGDRSPNRISSLLGCTALVRSNSKSHEENKKQYAWKNIDYFHLGKQMRYREQKVKKGQ